jgi:hypothetical protein
MMVYFKCEGINRKTEINDYATQCNNYLIVLLHFSTVTLTIEIDDCRKRKLDRLIAKILLCEGKKVTIQEVVDVMIGHALKDEDAFIQHFKRAAPLKEDPLWKMIETPKHLGIKDLSTSIDEHLYGYQG